MEHPEKISCNFPKLSQFKGQPWSSLTNFLNDTYTSKTCEEYGLNNCVKKELDMEIPEKSDMGACDLSRFHGQPWSSWIHNLDINALTNNADNENPDTRVTRLPRQDMGLFGICPENERFCAVVCSTCGAVVKAQALQRHLELKHTSDSETALLPPPQVPVKKNKTASVKMKSKEPPSTLAVPTHSSENAVSSFPTAVSVKPETFTNTTYSSRTSEAYSHSPRRKSPNISSDRKSQKNRDKELEIEKNPTNDDSNKQISRQLCSKPQLSTPRRSVTGRTKDFNKLVAEHRATKEQPSVVAVTSSGKSRPQSILKTVMATSEAEDSGFSSSSISLSSQSSQPVSQEPNVTLDSSPLQTSPPSPTLSLITSTCSDTPSTSSPTVNTTFSSSDYLVNSGSSACSSPNIINSSSNSTSTDIDNSVNVLVPSSVATVSDSNDCALPTTTTTIASTQLVQYNVNSNTQTYTNAPSHSFTVKLPRTGSPIIILNNSNAVNECTIPQTTAMLVPVSSVNTESIASSNSNVPVMSIPIMSPHSIALSQQPQPVVVSRDVIESLNVPVVMEMPAITDTISNITLYTTYPKPLVVTSTFSAKKIGHAVIVRNRRLELIRKKIKCLKIKKKINQALNIAMKRAQVQVQTQAPTPVQQSSSVPTATTVTMFGVKALNATTAYRFSKSNNNMHGIQATSLLAHRPNILRTASPKHRERETTVPKILSTGLKRPASSSPQLAGLDCKHMLLKPTANNINVNGIIGKMIMHQHDMTEHSSEGPTTNHIALDKVVPVNIK